MKIETKTYPSGNTVTVLSPDDNYKYITNGSVWSTKVFLGKNDSIDNWHDTTAEPLEKENEE